MFCVRYVITVMEYIDILFLGLGKGREGKRTGNGKLQVGLFSCSIGLVFNQSLVSFSAI